MKTNLRKTPPMIKNQNSLLTNLFPVLGAPPLQFYWGQVLPVALFLVLLGMNNHAVLAQCQAPTNLSPQDSKNTAWMQYLDTACRAFIVKISDIRANPKAYSENVLQSNIQKEKELYSNELALGGMESKTHHYRIEECDKKIYKTHTLRGKDALDKSIKERTVVLNMAAALSPQAPLVPCLELSQSATDHRKYYLELSAEGLEDVDIVYHEQCYGKKPIRKNWGEMPVGWCTLHQSKGETLEDFVNRILESPAIFKAFIAKPYCAIGLSRCREVNGGYIWFCFVSHGVGSEKFSVKPIQKM